jgi:intracellular septation protein A
VREALKIAVAILILATVTYVMFDYRRASAWWWSRKVRTRVLIALCVVALVGGVGVYYQVTR